MSPTFAVPLVVAVLAAAPGEPWARVTDDDRAIKIETDRLEAVIPKKEPTQWMTGIEKGSFLDKSTGFREVGDGLMVVDWLMEPGSDAAWSDKVIAPDGHGVGRYTWFANENDPAGTTPFKRDPGGKGLKQASPPGIPPGVEAKPRPGRAPDGPAESILPQPRLPRTGTRRSGPHPHPLSKTASLS